MAEFAPGMRIVVRDEEWVIRKVEENSLGNHTLICEGVSPLVKDREARFLDDRETIDKIDPENVKLVADTSPQYKKALLYIESQWRQKIPTDGNLHIGQDAAMDMLSYQLDPAKLALQKPRQRILIADAVGLGKTLEAGILMSELIARGKGKRILVVTVKSMMTQFQKEMWNRFTIPLVRLDSRKIQKIQSELPSNYNPFFYYDKTIISIDTLKDRTYNNYLSHAYWDIIVIDEAQNVAERGDHTAKRSKLAKLLAGRSDTMIMLSATPHDGRAKSFASLMNMLDETAIADPEHYTRDDIKGLCIRRFKKDIDTGDGVFLKRKETVEDCPASEKEEEAFSVFADINLNMDSKNRGSSEHLFKTLLEKAMFSSPAACMETIDDRIKNLEKKETLEAQSDIEELSKFRSSLEKISSSDFSRYQKLLKLLQSSEYAWDRSNTEDRIVIFTERIRTMDYLYENLRRDLNLKEGQIVKISGKDKDVDQQKIVEDFGRTESKVRILVASDVASEGLNLHHLCHRLIHFDIPWSFMVFQQRNGRIDRYGQKKRPDIRYMYIKSRNQRIKGDMRIIEILLTKEQNSVDNIGDPASLLNVFTKDDEEGIVMGVIENGSHEDEMEEKIHDEEDVFDPLDVLLRDLNADSLDVVSSSVAVTDKTLYSDREYVTRGLNYINSNVLTPVDEHSGVLNIKITDEMSRRLKTMIPEEAYPGDGVLHLSDDKGTCMDSMALSMQNSMDENAWPAVQYLWKLHPLVSWLNDKAGLLFKRDEAPVISYSGDSSDEIIFIISGIIPNEKSTPVVDEWFGVKYQNGFFSDFMTMEEVVSRTKINGSHIYNSGDIGEDEMATAKGLLGDVVVRAHERMFDSYNEYKLDMDPKIDEYVSNLEELRKSHIASISSKLTDRAKELKKEAQKIDDLFDKYVAWVEQTLHIVNEPYIRVIAVAMGV